MQNTAIEFIMNRVKQEDMKTYQHCLQVEVYSRFIGQLVGLPFERIDFLATAALLHDVGKISVPKDILLKPGKLRKKEFAEMQNHVLRFCQFEQLYAFNALRNDNQSSS